MHDFVKLSFGPLSAPDHAGSAVVFVGDDLALSAAATLLFPAAGELIKTAAATAKFKGKKSTAMELIAPHGVPVARLVAIGVGGEKDRADFDFVMLG